jgi:Carboxypeptidase regulatory-like domain/TonB dependent receptor-like, beta-barrel/TonB-dependent Receptor Plug Domain
MMRSKPLSPFHVLLVAGLLALPAAALAQTTGGITGTVTAADGSALPGVTVEATSPALQGSRVSITGGDGAYALAFLPPGAYHVSFTLEGFHTQEADLPVSLGRNATVDAVLQPSVATEAITVVASLPVVDTTTTTVGANLDTRAIETLPTGRNYTSVVQITPGVSSDANPENRQQSSITVYGSSGAENVYYIDGVNTTGAEYGFQGKELNFEFIQALDVKTGGYEAEFGRSTGGIINVITKSGGNELHGDVFAYYDNDSLQNSAKEVDSSGGTAAGFTRQDYGLDLGGFFVKDKLWFFAAYDRVKNDNDTMLPVTLPNAALAGQVVQSSSDRDLGAGKLTWRLNDSHSLIGTFFQDPRDDAGAISDAQHSLLGEPTTYEGVRSFGGEDYSLRYEGLFGGDWLATAQASRHQEENSVGPASGAGDAVQFRSVDDDFFQTGGFGLIQQKEFQRDFEGASLTRYLAGHELKGGLEYEEEDATVLRRYSGGQQVDVFGTDAGNVYSHFYWTTPTATIANAPVSALVASPKHKVTTAYLQDRWSVTGALTLSLGVRWDRQEIFDASGAKQIDLDKDYAPRLGFIWAPPGDAHQRLYGSWGRYYEQLSMDLVIRSFSFERQARIFNFSPTGTAPNADAEAALGEESVIFGGFTEPSDPDLENQYINEYILGFDREVAPELAVGIKGIYRDYGQVIEDFLCSDLRDGTYCIGNPGEGIMREIATLDYEHVFPAPEPERTFKGVQLDVNKRRSNNWQGMASYLYSKLDGNFDGLYAPFTNVGADPNISAAYDYYDFFTNGSDLTRITNNGPLSNDRRHQFKASGTYTTPWKVEVGASAYWRSGTPLTRYGYSDIYGRYEFFLSKRGAAGRTPDNYEVDLHFGYPWQVGRVTVNFLADVFSLLDAQRPVLLDQRWGFQESDNALSAPSNPSYGKAVLRTPPRTLRLGARISF